MSNQQSCLLIDNDEDDHEIFMLALEEVSPQMRCIAFTNGKEAVAKLNMEPRISPSFIFIDINMPVMNGMQCLEAIRKIESLKNVPIFMYSTAADPRTFDEIRKLGATDFIIKPAGFAPLKQLLAGIVNQTPL